MTRTEHIQILRNTEIMEVIISRPKKLNAITNEMLEAIEEAALDFEKSPELKVFLLRAEGRYFSAGKDISSGMTPDFNNSGTEARRWYRSSLQRIGDIFERIEKPSVVAHQGTCLGGALELSLSFDFRLAAEAAGYGLPEIRLGVIPGSGGTSRLTRIVGPHWARYLTLAGKSINAKKAEHIGLVHEVFGDDTFDDDVNSFCLELAALPPEAVSAAKVTIDLVVGAGREEGRQLERLANGYLMLGEEHHQIATNAVARLNKSSNQSK